MWAGCELKRPYSKSLHHFLKSLLVPSKMNNDIYTYRKILEILSRQIFFLETLYDYTKECDFSPFHAIFHLNVFVSFTPGIDFGRKCRRPIDKITLAHTTSSKRQCCSFYKEHLPFFFF